MSRTRRRFLSEIAGGAALTASAPSLTFADATTQTTTPPPGAGRYDYLGRTRGYRDWAVVPRGLTVKSIETFRRESLVRCAHR